MSRRIGASGDGWVSRYLPAIAASAACVAIMWSTTSGLSDAGRWTLLIFGFAMIGWILTPVDDTAVALAAAVALVATRAIAPGELYAALGSELVWLLIATFMISEVMRRSMLVERLTALALRRVQTVSGAFYILTGVIFATAFVIPSTSARAAMFLPIYLALVGLFNSAAIAKGLALLFPSVILLSAGGVLTGAGAHLLALELLGQTADTQRLDYVRWLVLALPIAIASCFAATAIILRMFVGNVAREALTVDLPAAQPLSARQRIVAAVLLAAVGLWVTAPWHGAGLGIVAIAAALVLTQPNVSGVGIKDVMRGVDWPLVLFFAATILLGQTMVTSGAGKWLADGLIATLPPAIGQSQVAIAACVSIVALLSHLVMVSRTARAAVLIPTFALPLSNFGYSPTALVLLTVIGTGFCQTLPVSAKPVMLFSRVGDEDTVKSADLVRLSAALFPVMLALLLAFALVIWPQLGLSLSQ